MSSSEVAVSRIDRPKCQWQCLKQNCSYITYNPEGDQCEIGLGECESLVPSAGAIVNVYWQPRDVCLHWGSYQEPGRVAVGGGDYDTPMYAGRTMIDEAMVLGKFMAAPNNLHMWLNNQGERRIIAQEPGTVLEVLTTAAGCPIFWVPYTGGKPIPSGAVVGGYLTEGTATYVARKSFNDIWSCGYYNTETEMIYYEYDGVKTSNTMEVLVLIWFHLLGIAQMDWRVLQMFAWIEDNIWIIWYDIWYDIT